MRRAATILLTLLMLALAGMARADTAITQKAQLNREGMRVGVSTGSASSLIAERELPKARIVYYEDNATAYEAVAQGKLDAFVFERVQMQTAIDNGRKGVHLLDEDLDEKVQVAIGISPKSAIPDFAARLDEFLAQIRSDGTLADMYRRWVELGDTTMPQIDLPESPQFHLRVGTAGVVPPYSYHVGTELSGYDIEMARRFAAWLNADLAFKVYDFGAIVPAAVSASENSTSFILVKDAFIVSISSALRSFIRSTPANISSKATVSSICGRIPSSATRAAMILVFWAEIT